MPENKRQHYVPKSVMRRFGSDISAPVSERRCINVLNFRANRVIENSSIKGQCYKDYFYGESLEVEKGLSQMEGLFDRMCGSIIDNGRISAEHRAHITMMLSLQRGRTLYAERIINEMSEQTAKLILHNRIPEEYLRRIRISFNNAINLSLRTSIMLSPLILDLKQILIVNKTSSKFLLSDNPVVVTNRFCRRHFSGHSTLGLASSGSQIACVISPDHVIMLHDSKVYSSNDINGVIELYNKDDVHKFNKLQQMNSLHNLYVPPNTDTDHIRDVLSMDRPQGKMSFMRRYSEREDGVYIATDKDEYAGPEEGVTSEMIQISSREHIVDISFPGIRFRSKPLFNYNGSMEGPIRDPAWKDIVREFSDYVQSKKGSFNDIMSYAARHPRINEVGPWLSGKRDHI